MRIHLLGFMGAGKSSLGPVLGHTAGLPFIDLDREIVRREGLSIPALFEDRGEAAFRLAEHEALAALADRKQLVLATGGGVVERPENRPLLSCGFCVYLYWPWELLRDRLFMGPEGRPVLEAGGDEVKLRWERRDPLYRDLAQLVCELGFRELRSPRRRQFRQLSEKILTAAREEGACG